MQTFRTLKLSKRNNTLYWVTVIVLLYLYIFQPPIISKYIFVSIEFIIFIIFQSLSNWQPFFKFYRIFKVEINILLLCVVYTIVRDLMSGEIVYSSRIPYFTFQAFFFSNYIIWQFRRENIEKYLLYTGIFASLVTIAIMVNSSVNSFVMNYMREELANYENFEIRYRGYGFSENITFTYSYVLGICASICLLKTNKKILYVFPFITCLIGVAFNARIGFIPIIITIIYSIFVNRDVKLYLKLSVGVFLVSCIAFCFFEEQIEIYKESSWLWISMFFYEISDFLFGTKFNSQGSMDMKNSSDYKLLDKKVVAELAKLHERNTFFRALSFWVGFKTTTVYYEVAERASGTSKWSTKSLVKYAINNVVCFSYAPLFIVMAIGAVFAAIGIILVIDTLVAFVRGAAADGFPTLLIVMLLGFGGVMISLGIIGVYLAQVYDEIKGRPQYIVSKHIGGENDAERV